MVFLDFDDNAGGVEVLTHENISIKLSSENISENIFFNVDNEPLEINILKSNCTKINQGNVLHIQLQSNKKIKIFIRKSFFSKINST